MCFMSSWWAGSVAPFIVSSELNGARKPSCHQLFFSFAVRCYVQQHYRARLKIPFNPSLAEPVQNYGQYVWPLNDEVLFLVLMLFGLINQLWSQIPHRNIPHRNMQENGIYYIIIIIYLFPAQSRAKTFIIYNIYFQIFLREPKLMLHLGNGEKLFKNCYVFSQNAQLDNNSNNDVLMKWVCNRRRSGAR